MVVRVNHQDTVNAILKAKAVDFTAIGKIIAELGPSHSLAEEPWEDFCSTMRYFVRIYHLPPIGPRANPIEDLAELQKIAGELRG